MCVLMGGGMVFVLV